MHHHGNDAACTVLFHLYFRPGFDKGYAFDFFCLEPMSHAPVTIIVRKVVTSLRLHQGNQQFRDVVAGCVAVIYKMPDAQATG